MKPNEKIMTNPRFCKKCGVELPSDSKYDKCEVHRRTIWKVVKGVLGVGTTIAGATGAIILWIRGKK